MQYLERFQALLLIYDESISSFLTNTSIAPFVFLITAFSLSYIETHFGNGKPGIAPASAEENVNSGAKDLTSVGFFYSHLITKAQLGQTDPSVQVRTMSFGLFPPPTHAKALGPWQTDSTAVTCKWQVTSLVPWGIQFPGACADIL